MTKEIAVSPITAVEGELANLRTRQAELQARKAEAEGKREAARSTRKAALAADTAGDITKHTKAVRDAEDEIETVDSVLTDVAAQITDVEERLADARDQDQREGAAVALEALAAQLGEYGRQFGAAMADVGRICREVVDTLPATMVIAEVPEKLKAGSNGTLFLEDYRGQATPAELIRIILAEGIAHAFRPAFAARHAGGDFEMVLKRAAGLDGRLTTGFREQGFERVFSPEHTMQALITDRLLARAEGIRNGSLTADLIDVAPAKAKEPPLPPKPPAPVKIVARETFNFRDIDGLKCFVGFETHELDRDIADMAVISGLAYRIGTPEAHDLQALIASGRAQRSRNGAKLELVRQADGKIISVERSDGRAVATVTHLEMGKVA